MYNKTWMVDALFLITMLDSLNHFGHFRLATATRQNIIPLWNDILLCSSDAIHYCDVIMGTIASQITSLTNVYSTVYRRSKKTSRLSVTGLCATGEFPLKWPVTLKMLPFDDVIMDCVIGIVEKQLRSGVSIIKCSRNIHGILPRTAG